MKLLIVTQVIDTDHPVLGFFHRWVVEFAKHCEVVHVICLQAGKQSLPANVIVHSLGKESGGNKLTYLWHFYKYIWQLRNNYDSVFVHMNQQYVVLGASLWKLLHKKVSLWYMHGHVSLSLRIAEKLVDRIFTGSAWSFRLPSKKVQVTGHGIDTARFAPQTVPKDLDLITVGRITKAKNLWTLIDILEEVRKTHPATLHIVGATLTEEEKAYASALRTYITDRGLTAAVTFTGCVSQADLPTVLNRSKVFVTAAQNGSLDKAVLEAMACGVSVVSMAPGTQSLPLDKNQVHNQSDFVERLNVLLEQSSYTNSEYVTYVQREHSLTTLIEKLL